MTHALKVWPEFFNDLKDGKKTFELRKHDRPFKEGDKLLLQEFDNESQSYTGDELHFYISYLLKDCPKFGLKPGFVILGLKEIE